MKLAILGGEPVRKRKFVYVSSIGKEEKQAVIKVMDKGILSGFYKDFNGGEKVREFEKAWADYFGVKHAIFVNSGTSALHISLNAVGVRSKCEVIVPAYSFTATASSVLMCNATPVFCDINPHTYNMDVEKIEGLITSKTKAVMPVHLFGQSAEMDKIMKIAKKYGLIVIEDTCQAPGSKYKNRYAGTIGHLGVFSTVETKNIVTGEGGVITTDINDFANRCKLIRNHGEVWASGEDRSYLSNSLGYNFRPTELSAAIGIEQLKKLKAINKLRNKLASYLLNNLKRLKGISLPMEISEVETVYHLLCLQYDKKLTGVSRELYLKALQEEGMGVTSGYPHPMYMNPLFKVDNHPCPVAESVCKKTIFIPDIRQPNTIEDMKDIVRAFRKIDGNLDLLKKVERK